MTLSALNRRNFIRSGLLGGLGALGGSGALAAEVVLLKPFRYSHSIQRFVMSLFWYEEFMPRPLLYALEADQFPPEDAWPLHMKEEPAIFGAFRAMLQDPQHAAKERQRAEFFAQLAVRNIAPRALRRAGYVAQADACAAPEGPWNLAAAGAQHHIGHCDRKRDVAEGRGPQIMPRLDSLAYGASAHAATTAGHARADEIETVVEAGRYCGLALTSSVFWGDEIEPADEVWVWNFAAKVINAAVDLDQDPVTIA